MSDALWNGFIGAGGAAICCAVYYGFKAARKGISKIKITKPTIMHEANTEQPKVDTPQESTPKQVTITLPTWKQLFTRQNIRAFGFIILGVVCFIALNECGCYYSSSYGVAYFAEGYDYQNSVLSNTYAINSNTFNIIGLLRCISEYFFGIVGGLFLLLGLTGFKFKK